MRSRTIASIFPLFRVRRVDEVKVAAINRAEIGHQALIDAMCIDDDPALGSLSEDLGQADDWHSTRCDDVGQNLPWPDRRKLIDIADEQQRSTLQKNALGCRRFRQRAADCCLQIGEAQIALAEHRRQSGEIRPGLSAHIVLDQRLTQHGETQSGGVIGSDHIAR